MRDFRRTRKDGGGQEDWSIHPEINQLANVCEQQRIKYHRTPLPPFYEESTMTHDLSYQCRLRQGDAQLVAWIEQRGAREGMRVELKGEAGLWDVVEVYQPGRSAAWLQENANRVHKGLPSLR
jgi:hypothetical protein